MSVDEAFLKAISTIKTMTRNGSFMGKPPQASRATLYGLYKQATEGDVEGIMPRPPARTPEEEANQRKWDSWKAQHGLTRQQAKLKYIEFLLETMTAVSSGSPESLRLVRELQETYRIAVGEQQEQQEQLSNKQTQQTPNKQPQKQAHSRVGSWTSSHQAYTPFSRRQTYSEFGLSAAPTERGSEADETPVLPVAPFSVEERVQSSSAWKQDVAWQLETITEEIGSIKRMQAPPKSPPPEPSRRTFLQALKEAWRLIQHVMRRIAVDVAALTVFLAVVRVVQMNPAVMARLPFTRKLFSILGASLPLFCVRLGLT